MRVNRLRTRRRAICRGDVAAVVLQIGSNDLTDDQCLVDKFVADYWQYIQYIRRRYRVQRAVVMEVLHRKEPLRYRMNMMVAEYNEKVDNTNAPLKVMCRRSTNVVFWQHNKHVRLPSVICRDGVHLHANGMKNYWRRVRDAVARCARMTA